MPEYSPRNCRNFLKKTAEKLSRIFFAFGGIVFSTLILLLLIAASLFMKGIVHGR